MRIPFTPRTSRALPVTAALLSASDVPFAQQFDKYSVYLPSTVSSNLITFREGPTKSRGVLEAVRC